MPPMPRSITQYESEVVAVPPNRVICVQEATSSTRAGRALMTSVRVRANSSVFAAMIFDDALIAKMKRGPYIINTARGKTCGRDAIVRALEGGQLAGCAGDVPETS